jgi:tetratricopeptide (TPR) repeat protein
VSEPSGRPRFTVWTQVTFALFAILAAASFAALPFRGPDSLVFAGAWDQPAFGAQWIWRGPVEGRLARACGATVGESPRPLMWASLALDAADPADHPTSATNATIEAVRRTNLVLLVATAAALAGLALVATRGRGGAAGALAALVATLAWAWHPLRSEVVGSVSARGTLLGTALLAVAALLWTRAVAAPTLRRGAFAASVACLAAALAAEPALFAAPIVFAAWTAWLRRSSPESFAATSDPSRIRRLLLVAAAPCVVALLATIARRESAGAAPLLASTLATASSIVRPFRATFAPVDLHPAYDPPPGFPDEIAASLWIDAATLTALVVVAMRGLRRGDGLSLALASYLALAAGAALLGREPVGADRFAHAATAPLLIACAAWTAGLPGVRRWIAVAAFAAAGWLASRGTSDLFESWNSEVRTTARVLRVDPTNERALVACGDDARRRGAPLADATSWYRRALEAGDWRPLAHARLGGALLETGDAAGARVHLERAIEIAPGLAAARFDLGALELRDGRLDAAKTHLETATRLDAGSVDAWRLLAQARDKSGDVPGALVAMTRAAALAPDDAGVAEELRRLGR